MTTVLDTLSKCLNLEGLEFFSADECYPFFAKSDQIDATISGMEESISSSEPDSVSNWFLALNSYSQSYSDYDIVPKAMSTLKNSLLAQKAALENSQDDQLAPRLEHIVDVAIASTVLVSAAWTDEDDPQAILASFSTLQDIVHDDGEVSSDESLVIDILDNYMSRFFTLGGKKELLNLAKTDVKLTPSEKKPILTTKSAAFYTNLGTSKVPSIGDEDNIPESYSIVPEDDERLEGMVTDKQCFSFALSKEVSSISSAAAAELEENYEIVDLRKKKAKAGDVILYTTPRDGDDDTLKSFDPLSEFHHLAVVTEVDKKGFPKKVMSKLGEIEPIYEHPVDEAPLSYGIMWTVYRKK